MHLFHIWWDREPTPSTGAIQVIRRAATEVMAVRDVTLGDARNTYKLG